jgi:hypothetical protein
MRAEAAGRLPLFVKDIMFIRAGAPISETPKRAPKTAPYNHFIIQVPPFSKLHLQIVGLEYTQKTNKPGRSKATHISVSSVGSSVTGVIQS